MTTSQTGSDQHSMLGRQMMLPLRHGGLGLYMQSDEVSDATSVAGAGQADCNLKGRPAALCPLQGAGGASVREQWSSLHARYEEQCKWDAATKVLPTEFLDSQNGLLGAQQLVRRKSEDAPLAPHDAAGASSSSVLRALSGPSMSAPYSPNPGANSITAAAARNTAASVRRICMCVASASPAPREAPSA